MTSTALDPKQKTLKDLLQRAAPALSRVIPKHLTVDRLISIALAAAARDSKLLDCVPHSVLRAVMQATQLGLEPGGPLGECYLIPYGNQCTFITGYRGYIKLARQSGQVQSIEARVVHAKDRYRCVFGLDPVLEHQPSDEEDPGLVTKAYAIARLTGGGQLVEEMTRRQLDGIKNRSKASSSGPWKTDEEEMQRKTVVRRIAKYLPMSPELAQAISHDDATEAGERSPLEEMDVLPAEVVEGGVVEDGNGEKKKDLKSHLKSGQQGELRQPGEEG